MKSSHNRATIQANAQLRAIAKQLLKARVLVLLVALVLAFVGQRLYVHSHAATPFVSVEPENGTITKPATKVADSAASSSNAVKFAAPTPPPPPPPVPPPVPPPAPSKYLVSLGGSIAAGLGSTGAPTATRDIDCSRFTNNFPSMVAGSAGLQLVQLACSGAKTSTGLLQPQTLAHSTAVAQIQAAAPYVKGSVVTIFVGANDVNWIDDQENCLGSGCPTSTTAAFTAGLTTITNNLTSVIKQLQTDGARTILVNKYYAVTTGDSSCLTRKLTAADTSWLAARLAGLNDAISSAATQNGATVVTPNFAGHYVCSADPWVNNIGQGAPMHPTLAGQKAIAAADEAALKGK